MKQLTFSCHCSLQIQIPNSNGNICCKVGRLCNRKRPSLIPPVTSCFPAATALFAAVRTKPKFCLPYQFLKYQRDCWARCSTADQWEIQSADTCAVDIKWKRKRGTRTKFLSWFHQLHQLFYQTTCACLIFACVWINQTVLQNRSERWWRTIKYSPTQ
jgi:hypothetical protein